MARARGCLSRGRIDYLILHLLLMAFGAYATRILITPEQTESNIRAFPTVSRTVRKRASGPIDLTMLRRGNVYAINVHGNTFKLVRVDLGTLQLQHLYSPDSLGAHLRSSYPAENVGWAWYADTYTEDGWYRLEIRIDQEAPFPDVLKARAAGFVEGNLQGQHMYRYWTNYRMNEYAGRGEAPSQQLYDWFDEQYGWMTKRVHRATGWTLAMLRGEAASPVATINTKGTTTARTTITIATQMAKSTSHEKNDGNIDDVEKDDDDHDSSSIQYSDDEAKRILKPSIGFGATEEYDDLGSRYYWTLVGLVSAQFEGLTAGFWASVVDPARNMTWHELYALNAVGDLYELNVLFPPTAQPTSSTAEAEAMAAAMTGSDDGRWYRPGHGEVGPYGYGEELECSAIIKIDVTKHEEEEDEDEGDDDDNGDDNDEDEDIYDDHEKDNDGQDETVEEEEIDENGGVDSSWEDDVSVRDGGESTSSSSVSAGSGEDARTLGFTRSRRLQLRHLLGSTRSGESGHGRMAATGKNVRQRQKRLVRNFWASHNTWRPYYDMVRTWKVYDLPWSATGPLTVSSSPGLLHSKDDWYTTDTFVVMETTNGIYNKDLYDRISSKCVLMWQRAQVANFGARRGDEWVDLFSRSNSGTYNNQWMVLDVQRLRHSSASGVLWVLEQVPGKIVSKDASRVLYGQGYWASYNVPYFPEIYNLTGYPQPSIYDTCPRARLFSREQVGVSSRPALMSLMRLNRYQSDPLSLGLPNNAIAARYDLPAAPNPDGTAKNWTRKAYGAVDAKVVDLESFMEGRTYVINGPTTSDQPPFDWSSEPAFANIQREGCVDRFDFDWQAYQSVVGPPRSGSPKPMAS